MAKTECPKCQKSRKISAANAVAYLFDKQPWFSYLDFFCLSCETHWRLLFGPLRWEAEIVLALKAGVGVNTEDFPPAEIVEAFENIFDIHPPEEHQLTPRDETQMEWWRYLLDYRDILEELG